MLKHTGDSHFKSDCHLYVVSCFGFEEFKSQDCLLENKG